jgi:hypothetical protein
MTENTVEDVSTEDSTSEQEQRSDTIVTVVLTADNHLGYNSFGQSARKREEGLQRLRRAFQQATDFAVGQGVDLFIQAGDLFDTPTPDERDRSFVAARLAQLRQADVRVFVLGGVHDTPVETHTALGEVVPPPQSSYAHLGVLHYFAPNPAELEPVIFNVRDVTVGICGLGVLAGQEGNPLELVHVQYEIERAALALLVLHAPIEGLTGQGSRGVPLAGTLLDARAQISRASIENQSAFRFILAGYHHSHQQLRIGRSDVIVAGATQNMVGAEAAQPHAGNGEGSGRVSIPSHRSSGDRPESGAQEELGFVFLGLAADGIRWCKHIAVDALNLQRVMIHTDQLWGEMGAINRATATAGLAPTDIILEQLSPMCNQETIVQLRLEGSLTRSQYHQLDLNQLRRYGEENCFALAIDDSGLEIVEILRCAQDDRAGSIAPTGEEAMLARTGERFSPRQELVALADEWIAAASDEQDKKTLRLTKEDLLAALDSSRTM